jgi:hypothetical protein
MYPVAADQITIRDADYTVNSTLTNPLSLNQTTVPTMVKVRYADVGYKTDLEKPIVNQTTLPTMIKVRYADAGYRSGIEKPLVEQTTLPTMIEVRHADVSYRSGIEKPLVEQTTLPTMIKVRYADASYRSGLEEPAVNQTTLPTMIKVRHADVIFRSDLSDLPGDQDSTGPTSGNAEILEFSHTTGTVEPWSQGAAVVVISNTGTTTRSFWVGLSYKKQGASEWIDIDPQQSIDIYPGGSANVQFSWTLTDEAGTYDIFTKIWNSYNASTNQMIPPSYDERTDTGAFIIADRPRHQIFRGTSAEDFDGTLNFPSTYGDTVSVYYNPLANTLSISLYAWGDVQLSRGIIEGGAISLAIPEELDINYEQVRIFLMTHDTGDPEVATTTNIVRMSLDVSNSAVEQWVDQCEIAKNLFAAVTGIISSSISFIMTILGIDLPQPELVDIPDDSKFEDVNNYDNLEIFFVDPDKIRDGSCPDIHKVFVLIPLEGNYEGKSIAIRGGYKTTDGGEIRQFYKENIVLR